MNRMHSLSYPKGGGFGDQISPQSKGFLAQTLFPREQALGGSRRQPCKGEPFRDTPAVLPAANSWVSEQLRLDL